MSANYRATILPLSNTEQTTISPITGEPVLVRSLPTTESLESALKASHEAYLSWRSVPLSEKIAILTKAVDILVSKSAELAQEITEQMGRPIRYGKGEIGGFEERAR